MVLFYHRVSVCVTVTECVFVCITITECMFVALSVCGSSLQPPVRCRMHQLQCWPSVATGFYLLVSARVMLAVSFSKDCLVIFLGLFGPILCHQVGQPFSSGDSGEGMWQSLLQQ